MRPHTITDLWGGPRNVCNQFVRSLLLQPLSKRFRINKRIKHEAKCKALTLFYQNRLQNSSFSVFWWNVSGKICVYFHCVFVFLSWSVLLYMYDFVF